MFPKLYSGFKFWLISTNYIKNLIIDFVTDLSILLSSKKTTITNDCLY